MVFFGIYVKEIISMIVFDRDKRTGRFKSLKGTSLSYLTSELDGDVMKLIKNLLPILVKNADQPDVKKFTQDIFLPLYDKIKASNEKSMARSLRSLGYDNEKIRMFINGSKDKPLEPKQPANTL